MIYYDKEKTKPINENDFVLYEDGTIELKLGGFYCYGKTVDAYEGSIVYAYEGSIVDANEGSLVNAYEGSLVNALKGSIVHAYRNSTVHVYKGSTVHAYNRSKVCIHECSTVYDKRSSTVCSRRPRAYVNEGPKKANTNERSIVYVNEGSILRADKDLTIYANNVVSIINPEKSSEIDTTLDVRKKNYGDFEDNSRITQSLYNVIKTAPNYDKLSNEHKEAFHMIFHKIARCVCGDCMYVDNIHDITGYSTLLEKYLIKCMS